MREKLFHNLCFFLVIFPTPKKFEQSPTSSSRKKEAHDFVVAPCKGNLKRRHLPIFV